MTREKELADLRILLDALETEEARVSVVGEYLYQCHEAGCLDALEGGVAVADILNLLAPASRLALTQEQVVLLPQSLQQPYIPTGTVGLGLLSPHQ